MFTVFIIILALLVIGGYALTRRKRLSLDERKAYILGAPTDFSGLFAPTDSAQLADEETQAVASGRRAQLLERARQFDLSALDETRREPQVYAEVLAEFIRQSAVSQDQFQALVGHLSQHQELKANAQLVEMMLQRWAVSPDNKATVQLLHLAALADDAAVLQRAIERAAAAWQQGLLPNLTANDFLALAESEYWVLASEARRSGAGYILKSRLVELRRTLAATKRG
ncbi:MAG: hypothetical protein HY231_25240 [Acidobacteria bacterium]|nr:hypothetical protein [Acidobacteriota bacterium]